MLGSGQTLSVKGHRLIDGDRIVLQMRSGGEVTCDKSLIEKILPDEVPFRSRDAGSGRDGRGSGGWRLRGPDGDGAVRRDHHHRCRRPTASIRCWSGR